jgi:Na+-driven multidrug efflux pump
MRRHKTDKSDAHEIAKFHFRTERSTTYQDLKVAISISTAVAIAFFFLSESIFSIFTSNAEIINLGNILLLLTIMLEPGRATNLVVINSLKAAGAVRFPVYIGVLSMWGVAVPAAYSLGVYFSLGLIGIGSLLYVMNGYAGL